MKIQLETIPVWEGVKEGSECFICSLMRQAEADGVRFYLSSACMTPEIRVSTNTHGFCPHHMSMLAEGGNPQSLALTLDTYYEENKRILYPDLEKACAAGNARKAMRSAEEFFHKAHEREAGCLICSRMDDRLMRYAYTVAALWKEDSDFRKALGESKGFCLHHTEALVHIAPEALSGNDLAEYIAFILKLLRDNLDRVQHDDWWMTQKYKSENKDKPWDGCEDAQRRAAYKLVGQARVIDPVKERKR